MRGDARIEPAGVDVVANKVWRLDHLHTVVDDCADLAADLHLLQSHHHGPDGRLASVTLGEEMPELQQR